MFQKEGEMSYSKRLKKKIQNRIKKTDKVTSSIKDLIDLVPILQRKKEDDQTSLEILNNLPKDIVEESAPRWLRLEEENDKSFYANLPAIPKVTQANVSELASTAGGTATPYVYGASYILGTYNLNWDDKPKWAENVDGIIGEHSKRIAQREYLPGRLDLINRDLGKAYVVALASYDKCRNGLVTVDQAAVQLRDILQQVWGGLSEMASNKNKDPKRNTKHLELKNEGNRDLVADILATEAFPKVRLTQLLSEMNSLSINISRTDFLKNPLNTDFPSLNNYFNQWISLLDGVSSIVLQPFRPVEGT